MEDGEVLLDGFCRPHQPYASYCAVLQVTRPPLKPMEVSALVLLM